MQRRQRGLGAVGVFFLVLIVLGGYFAYKALTTPDAPPSCAATLSTCVASCRHTSTEAPAVQSCQEACQRDAAACERK
jgi:hypothetical protein